jgi:hypothetical protein
MYDTGGYTLHAALQAAYETDIAWRIRMLKCQIGRTRNALRTCSMGGLQAVRLEILKMYVCMSISKSIGPDSADCHGKVMIRISV